MADTESPISIPDIIDNSVEGQKLCDVLNALLVPGSRAHFASAYFNLGGFSLVKDSLSRTASLRLLLGREPSLSGDTTRTGHAVAIISDDLRADTEEAMASKETPSLIQEFLDFVQRPSVEVRVCSHFSHGKAYVIEGVPLFGQVAIQGSSNFTAAGLTANWELNSVLKQSSAVQGIKDWFERFWERSEDYKAQLIELLTDFTRTYSPYDIYMKTLYEYFKDRFDIEVKVDGPSPVVLADFQHDGYLAAKDIIETYGGVFLSDSVGLGKTYLALKLLDDYAYKLRQKAMVVCPAQLGKPEDPPDPAWWPRKLRDYVIRADIITQEELSRSIFPVEEFLEYDLVVVDESHNFRNATTNRYENLSRILTLGKPKKVILLTATPVNNSIFDLYNQIQLITRGQEDFFASAGIRNLWGYFLQAEADKQHLYDLLEEIAIRRSRHYIRKNYPDAIIDGKPVRFPERKLHTVRYSLEETYSGLYQEIADVIENLNLASYSYAAYRRTARRQQLALWETLKERLIAVGWAEKEAEAYTFQLGRQLALVQILKTLYLKRLESSIEALRISLERQRDFQARFLELLRKGKLLDAASYRRIFVWSGSEDESAEGEAAEDLISLLPTVEPKDFDLEALEKAVDEDVQALNRVLAKMPTPVAPSDSKLARLKEELLRLKNEKIVVFTYFRDTARYLYRELQEDKDFMNNLGRRMSIVDSGIDSRERSDRITRFAPLANDKPQLKGTDREIDLLISTDVLSEGQNLQDANTVVNYDLHWNPVRMIQRAGRIDRIGSDWDLVHIYNFFPEDRLESLLRLLERLFQKLDAIKRSVGLDASTLGEAVDPKDFNAIRRIQAEDPEVVEELEQASELVVGEFIKQELLDFLRQAGEERLKRIPLGVGSGMKRPGQHGLFVYLKGGDRHFWTYYDLATGKMTERKLEVMRLIQSAQSTVRSEPDFDPYEIIDRVKKHIVNRFRQLQASPLVFKAPQSQILNLLKSVQGTFNEASELLNYFSTPLPGTLLRPLRKIWDAYRRGGEVQELLRELKAFTEANPIATPATVPAGELELREEDLQLVCWLALTG